MKELTLPTLSLEKQLQFENLDFTLIKFKLKDAIEGEAWSTKKCNNIELYYKRFLILNYLFPEERIVPTKDIDTFWHYHILDTRHYIKTTKQIFGKYLHHYPYFGIFGKEDKKNLEDAFQKTIQLYEEVFHEPLHLRSARCVSTCAGRCASK